MKNAIDYMAGKKHHPVDLVSCKPTPEMETFMTMFKRLQEMTEHHLQRSLNSSCISVPNFFNHRHKVLAIEAAECTGFRVVLPEWWLDDSAATAGIAATGIGMCKHYRSMARCVSERGVMSPENVLVVDYSQAALGAALVKVRHGTYERNPSYFTDVDMGAVSPWRSDQGEAAYWNQIKARLQDLPKRAKIMPTRLIFMGDSVSDKTFLNVLRDALMELSGQSFEDQIAPIDFNQAVVDWLVQMETADPLFRAAIGAAELAKRSMESPGGCMESTSCYEEKGEKKDTS